MLNFTIPQFIVPKSAAQARSIQADLKPQIILQNEFQALEIIAGVDVGYNPSLGLAHASIVIMALGNLNVIEAVQAEVPVDFPYIPGLLAFREIPAILAALSELSHSPHLFMVDGQGIAHPKRMGIAAHLGVILDMPSIGVAKSRLTGTYEMPEPIKGSAKPLMDATEQLGYVVRSKDNVRPLFVSPGHRVDISTALSLTMQCVTRYRLPEPTRMADKFSKYKKSPETQPALLI